MEKSHMFLVSKLIFAFAELNMRFFANVLLLCIVYCNTGPGRFVRIVCKYSILILITDNSHNIFVLARFSSETPCLYFEKAIRLSREVLMFLAAI